MNSPKRFATPHQLSRMADLESELQEISGVGSATAEKIIDVVEAHGESVSETDLENLKNGIDYVESGNPEYALKFFRRVEL